MFRNLRTRTAPSPPATKPKPASDNPDTVLGSNAVLEGKLTAEGNVHISGTFNGDITAKGNLSISEAGNVEGNVKAKAVAVGGVVRGDIDARRISVLRTGRVWGDLTTHSLSTEEGGFIQGVITMQSEEEEPVDEREVDRLLSDLEAQVAEVIEKKAKE